MHHNGQKSYFFVTSSFYIFITILCSETSVLTIVTFCLQCLQTKGFHYTSEDYEANSYQLSDLFTSETISKMKNESKYEFFEIRTMFYGKCFILCPLRDLKLEEMEIFFLNNRIKIDLSIFNRGSFKEVIYA
jgi:hypothetical protein